MSYPFPEILESAFVDGTRVKQYEYELRFSLLEMGKIKIPSGYVIACDPIVMYGRDEFTQKFPIGQFPVQLSIVKINNANERVAYSRIKFSDNDVVRWEFALCPGQDALPINGGKSYCFSVDAGLAVFIDKEAKDVFNKKEHSEWEKVFIDKRLDNQQLYREYYMHEFDGFNMAAFETGVGDGCYSTYIGYDAQGLPCRLLADFAFVIWLEEK